MNSNISSDFFRNGVAYKFVFPEIFKPLLNLWQTFVKSMA